ncbi:HDOD domain-containing protein [Anaeromyxobacter paludicola]|uniref:HDOD domain-containing protein n=1 Tax=Anaeromyxobacter paludicola TaxID=2918171 RepID=A0ABM7XBW7_9BACT|nr:HDOD domain-containing protein [Anaeromyxobacter paludicola]BDG09361.1 hypothetical protein AMPC_24740 [Anaeromyxobacter paludicola]
MDTQLEQRILSCPSLPSLPAVALEVLQLCHAEEIDLTEVAAVVSRDPALAAQLLRAANSASFATRGQVATARRAVALLGSNATLAVVLSFSLVRQRRQGPPHGLDHQAFWRRAVFSAIAGRALGEQLGLEAEEAFLCCLLQDLGILALAEVFPADYGSLYAAAEGDHDALVALEREALDVDHGEASRLLAAHWKLPAIIQEAAIASHAAAPPEEEDDARRRFLECVYLSGRLADVWVSGAAARATREALEAGQARLGLGPEVIATILARMGAAVPEASADFELDLGGGRVEAVLDEARSVLDHHASASEADARPGATAWAPDALELATAACLARARARYRPLAAVLVAPCRADTDLASLKDALLRTLRPADLLGPRKGALLAVLLETGADEALAVAERMRASASVPLAVGVALHDPERSFTDVHELQRAAEAALAASRAAGGRPAWVAGGGPREPALAAE